MPSTEESPDETAAPAKIKSGVPLERIQLTETDYLIEDPRADHHTRDEDELVTNIGLHEGCGGQMQWRRTSSRFYRITCVCGKINVSTPIGDTTYRALRVFTANHPGGAK